MITLQTQKDLLRPIYPVRFLFTIVACDFYSARCSRHGKIVYNRPRSICFAAQGGNYTKSRPGGRRVELWRQPGVSLILFFFGHFSIFCFGNGTDLYSLYLYHLQVWKRWNLHSKRRGKWVKASLMLVNRTRRRKKFLELAIWEVFTEGNAAWWMLTNSTYCSNFVQCQWTFSSSKADFLIKEDLTESFHLERRRI